MQSWNRKGIKITSFAESMPSASLLDTGFLHVTSFEKNQPENRQVLPFFVNLTKNSQIGSYAILPSWFLSQKFRENNFFTNKSFCELTSWKIFQARVNFSEKWRILLSSDIFQISKTAILSHLDFQNCGFGKKCKPWKIAQNLNVEPLQLSK